MRSLAATGPTVAALFVICSVGTLGCGGGAPLLHPARTLPTGDVRLSTGLSANVVTGELADDLRTAREIGVRDPQAPGAPGTNPEYAAGALVAAAVAPGISPYVAMRVGIGYAFEGGLTYTGRSARADVRHSFDDGPWSLSVGAGLSAALYGRLQGGDLPNVDLGALRGYGADIPVLAGWHSTGGLYMFWIGTRGGVESDTIEALTSEPKDVAIGVPPIRLQATRWHAGGLFGMATGFRHVHVALELDAGYQVVNGTYNGTSASVSGFAITPASAIWWTF